MSHRTKSCGKYAANAVKKKGEMKCIVCGRSLLINTICHQEGHLRLQNTCMLVSHHLVGRTCLPVKGQPQNTVRDGE